MQNKGRILTPQGERFLEEERSRREKMKAANELIEAASMETESGLEDILLVRKLLEGYAAEACAERIEPKELQKLKDLQADYLYAIRHGKAGSEEDLAFHLKIAHLSGSPSILRMLKLILTDQDAYARFNQAAVRSDEVRENEHESLLAAIEAGDGALGAPGDGAASGACRGEPAGVFCGEKVGFVRIINKKKFMQITSSMRNLYVQEFCS